MNPHNSPNKNRLARNSSYKLFGRVSKLMAGMLLLPVVVGLLQSAHAASQTWTGSASQEWNDTNNWSNQAFPDGAAATVSTATGNYPIVSSSSLFKPGDLLVGSGSGSTGRLDQTAGTLSVTNGTWMKIGDARGTGTFNITGGTLNVPGELHLGESHWVWATEVGTLNMSGAGTVVNAGAFYANYGDGPGENGQGTFNMNGGTLNCEGDFCVVRSGANTAFGEVNIAANATINVATTTKRWLIVSHWDSAQARMNVNGGTVNLNANTDLRYCVDGNTGVNVVNLNSGTITSYSGNKTGAGGGVLDLNRSGGTVNNTFNLNGGTLTIAQIMAGATTGTRVFNFNGGTLKPTASSTSFFASGVATAANVLTNGVVIDTAGCDITIGQSLQDGGGNGGLTKFGNGALTLSGASTYTGPTKVLGGSLSLSTGGGNIGSTSSDVVVSNATLAVDASSANQLLAANVTLNTGAVLTLTANPSSPAVNGTGNLLVGTNTVLNLNYSGNLYNSTPSAAAVNVAGSMSVTGTNNVINITGTGFSLGQFPLIKYGSGGLVSISGFKVGTLPAGVAAVLVNNTGNQSVDLNITFIGQNLTWYGAYSDNTILSNWDINVSTNWSSGVNTYKEYGPSTNRFGDLVTFDDNGLTYGVNLTTTLHPSQVTVGGGNDYTFSGPGSITGSGSLVMNGSGSLTLLTSNSYTGGTFVNAGTINITNDSALGANSSVLTLAGGALQINGNIAGSVRAVTLTANANIGVLTNVTGQLGGTITGTGNLTKTGNGTLALSGANTFTGVTTVGAGTLNVTTGGQIANTGGGFTVGNTAGVNALLTVTGGSVSDSTTTDNAWSSFLQVGNGSSYRGFINMNSGSLNAQRHLFLGNNGGYGAMTMSGGTLTVGSYFGVGFASGYGVFNQSGGSATQNQAQGAGATLIGSGAGSIGVMNLSGGTFTATAGGIFLPENNTCTGTLNISGSAAVTVGNVGVKFGNDGAASTGTLNLLGGTLTVNTIARGNTAAGTANFNFNGGTLKANTNNASFMTGLTAATIYGGGAKIDDGGFAITIGQILASSSGDGVASISVDTAGDSYLDAPVVTISGGSGTGATAIAQINPTAGTVTNILITCPGTGYASGDSLTVTLSGGGASTPATVGATVTFAANTAGNLLKLGAGTLTIDGVNTYTGATVVNSGTLAGTGTIAGALTNNANLSPGDSGVGSLTVNGNIVLKAGSTNVFAVNGTTPANNSVVAGGNVTYGGVLNIVPSGTFTLGQTFTLFSGAGAASASNFASIEGSPGSGLAFSFTNGVLSVVTASGTSTNDLLSGLVISPAGTLAPGFSSNIFSYTATEAFTNSPIAVTTTSADANATLQLSFNGGAFGALTSSVPSAALTLNANPGVTNVVDVKVTAQDNVTVKDYIVNVVRVPSQLPAKLTNSVSGGVMTLTWPLDHLGYQLMVQTGHLTNGISSNTNDWSVITGSAATNIATITITNTIKNEYYKLVYP